MNNAQLTKEVKELKELLKYILKEVSVYGSLSMSEATELLKKL
jgi:hypothetical protein